MSGALGLIRIVAAAAIDQAISRKPAPDDGTTPEGRVRVRQGLIRPVSVTVSSATTADDVARARATRGAAFSTTRQQQLDGLQTGLLALTEALYRREPGRDAAPLDEAVRHAIRVSNEIASERRSIHLRRGANGGRGQQPPWAQR
jgi:hypothetical protein